MLDYMVIYPCGDRSRIDIAQVRDYEKDEWDLASRRCFGDDENAAKEYALELAYQYGLKTCWTHSGILD